MREHRPNKWHGSKECNDNRKKVAKELQNAHTFNGKADKRVLEQNEEDAQSKTHSATDLCRTREKCHSFLNANDKSDSNDEQKLVVSAAENGMH